LRCVAWGTPLLCALQTSNIRNTNVAIHSAPTLAPPQWCFLMYDLFHEFVSIFGFRTLR